MWKGGLLKAAISPTGMIAVSDEYMARLQASRVCLAERRVMYNQLRLTLWEG